ncbi:hypothetical protein [Microbispora sp. H10830]|uniref:hypothetical protein n=1 Tax=Microbispora sp. H10830 TaxID=2729109 RepID=UPI00160368E2|nr:hypothetical protein [Microbispora sp. H10830]
MRPSIVDVEVLNEDECAEVRARVEDLRPHWLSRGSGYFTLGLAAYLDVVGSDRPEQTYYGRLAAQNQLIHEHFGDLLDRVARTLSEVLAMPTRYDDGVALPGFHVFEGEAIAVTPRPSQHFDLQHRNIRWPFDLAEVEQLVSFTLPVALPQCGGALEYWDVTEPEVIRLERLGRTLQSIGNTKPVRRHEYRIGWMSVQRRPLMHRIAAISRRHPGDQRVTLQGHGIRDAGGWVLYW